MRSVWENKDTCPESPTMRPLFCCGRSFEDSRSMESGRCSRLDVVEDPLVVGADAGVDAGPSAEAAGVGAVAGDAHGQRPHTHLGRRHDHQRPSGVALARVLARLAARAHLLLRVHLLTSGLELPHALIQLRHRKAHVQLNVAHGR